MKRLIAFALLVSLGGCGVWGEMTTEEKVKAIQEKAVALCSYMPQATSVAAMLSAANPTAVSIGTIANAICVAVIQWKNGDRSSFAMTCPKVNGVCVTGEWINPKGN